MQNQITGKSTVEENIHWLVRQFISFSGTLEEIDCFLEKHFKSFLRNIKAKKIKTKYADYQEFKNFSIEAYEKFKKE